MSNAYNLQIDSHQRWCADIAEDVKVGIKILAETDPRRVEKRIHGYAVLDIRTALGPIRLRDVRILWSEKNERFFLRWHQWFTGQVRDGRKEYLDAAGPHDKITREKFEEAILAVFQQVREEAGRGTLGRNQKSREQLQGLKEQLLAHEEAPAPAPEA